jgi:hypothetical protein
VVAYQKPVAHKKHNSCLDTLNNTLGGGIHMNGFISLIQWHISGITWFYYI